jgi:hypothetical protein
MTSGAGWESCGPWPPRNGVGVSIGQGRSVWAPEYGGAAFFSPSSPGQATDVDVFHRWPRRLAEEPDSRWHGRAVGIRVSSTARRRCDPEVPMRQRRLDDGRSLSNRIPCQRQCVRIEMGRICPGAKHSPVRSWTLTFLSSCPHDVSQKSSTPERSHVHREILDILRSFCLTTSAPSVRIKAPHKSRIWERAPSVCCHALLTNSSTRGTPLPGDAYRRQCTPRSDEEEGQEVSAELETRGKDFSGVPSPTCEVHPPEIRRT